MSVEIQLWNEDATNIEKIVSDSVGASFRDARNETGAGQLTVPDTAEYRALFARDLVVKHVEDGRELFAWTIEEDTRNPLGDPPTITAAGRGLLCWYEWGTIYPARGLKRKSNDVRYFGFGSGDNFGEDTLGGEWMDAVAGTRTTSIPPSWPTTSVSQMWVATIGNDRPAGEEAWFYRGFTTTGGQYVRIDTAADDKMQLWLDDDLLITMDGSNTTNPGAKLSQTIRMILPAGDHWLNVKASNRTQDETNDLGSNDSGPAWVAVRVAKITDDDDAGTAIVNAGTSWRATTDEPGWPIGFSIMLALDEAIARGVDRMYHTGMTFDWDVDSNGEPWPHVVNRTWPVGADMLQVFLELAEMGADIWMTPDKVLHAAINRGEDRSDSISLYPAGNLGSYGITRKHKVRTHAIVKTGVGWTTVDNPEGKAAKGRAETRIDFGSIDSIKHAKTVASQALAPLAKPAIDTTGDNTKLIPWVGGTPYKDFGLGDVIGIPEGTARVMGISNQSAAGDGGQWYLELDVAKTGARTVSKTTQQQLLTIAASGGASSVGGRIKSASK